MEVFRSRMNADCSFRLWDQPHTGRKYTRHLCRFGLPLEEKGFDMKGYFFPERHRPPGHQGRIATETRSPSVSAEPMSEFDPPAKPPYQYAVPSKQQDRKSGHEQRNCPHKVEVEPRASEQLQSYSFVGLKE
jgi:hypothetical protein